MTDLAQLTAVVRAFSVARDWEQFQDPKSLMLALVGEVGELSELMQWIPQDEVLTEFSSPERKDRISDEIADVLIYLIRLADVMGVDLEEAALAKLARNEKRFPVTGPASTVGTAPVKH